MAEGLLTGYRALDLTDEKGFVCGKILAAMGVETIKVEKPGGDPARGIPPFLHNTPDPSKSLYWSAFNTDKRSITLNLDAKRGQDMFRRLAKTADFLLESATPGYLDERGIGFEALKRVNHRIIVTSITPFGQKGPYAHYKASELIASAMSGVLATNGDPDRPPVREGTDAVCFESNAAAALGTVIAHYHRESTGEGQHVDISLQEVAAKRTSTNMVVWEFDKRLIKRNGTVRTMGARSTHWIWPCKDGYVFWSYMGGKFGAPANRALSQWINEDGLDNPLKEIDNWDEFDMAATPQEVLAVHQNAIRKFFMNHTKKEIEEGGLKRGINASVVSNPADVLKNPQFDARHYWSEIDDPEYGTTLAYPKYFFLSNKTENFVKRRAPHIGEDNREIYSNLLGLSGPEIEALKSAGII